jgi:predicted MFS family arabinose efflux permease
VTSGVIIGILAARTVAGLLSDLAGWRSVYALSAAATLLIAFLLAKQLPRHEMAQPRMPYTMLIGSVFSLFLDVPVLRVRGTIALLMFASITALWTPMVLPLSAPPLSLSHTEVGLFGLAGVVGALGAARAGRMADRGGAERTTAVGLVAMLLSWVPIAFLEQSLLALAIGVVIIDYGLQSVHVTSQSIITRERPEARSRLIAGYMIFYSVGCGIGAILSTIAYDRAGWLGVCLTGGSFSAAALIYWAASAGQVAEPVTPCIRLE